MLLLLLLPLLLPLQLPQLVALVSGKPLSLSGNHHIRLSIVVVRVGWPTVLGLDFVLLLASELSVLKRSEI